MAYFMKDEFPDVDINKVILMCIMHDFGEAFTGDIPAFDKTSDDENTEGNVIKEWIDSLPEPYRTELAELFAEMKERKTTEAKLYKALDKMEAVIQHNEADISTWLHWNTICSLHMVRRKQHFQMRQGILRRELMRIVWRR